MKSFLPKNMNTMDRIVRYTLAGLVLGYAYFKLSWIALSAGLFILFEASFSWCVFYQILGKNNCPLKKRK